MKKFKHTRRSGFAFTLFGPFTLFILNWVMLAHARSEVNSITKDKEGYKKSMPFICAILLGLLTLGIVPLVWLGNLAGKIKRLSQEYGVEKKARGGAFVICWLLFGSLILVGPFVAFMGFFRSLNRLEKKLNELAEAGEGEPKEELELKEEPKEEGEPMEELE